MNPFISPCAPDNAYPHYPNLAPGGPTCATNGRSAQFASDTLKFYMDLTGLTCESPETVIGDLMEDTFHLLHAMQLDPDRIMIDSAARAYDGFMEDCDPAQHGSDTPLEPLDAPLYVEHLDCE